MESKKIYTHESIDIYKAEIDTQIEKTSLWLLNNERVAGVGINQEFGIKRYLLLYIKEKNKKHLLYCTEDYIEYLIIIYNRNDSEKEYMYVLCIFITESLCYTFKSNTPL